MTTPNARRKTAAGVTLSLLALAALAACTDNSSSDDDSSDGGDARALSVDATDDSCDLSAETAPSGKLTFSVTNGGSEVTEFYLLGDDGLRIIGEVENIGPGLSRDLVLTAPAGDYFTACKPGMVGDGIRADFEVTDSGEDTSPTGTEAELVATANANYQAYVKDQTEQLVTKTNEFAELYTSGQDDEARALYPVAREHWERIETVAESFGDLDPKMDLREADLEPGAGVDRLAPDREGPVARARQELPAARRSRPAEVRRRPGRQHRHAVRPHPDPDLHRRPDRQRLPWPARRGRDRQGHRRGGVLVAHRPLGLPGQRRRRPSRASTGSARCCKSATPTLDENIDAKFTELQTLLDAQRDGDGFVLYSDLTEQEIKALSDAVNALSEPLSQLANAVA